ncbi:type V CRISPR-associated endonuclease Cas1 [Brumimicrobium aurantiacum]|uniref:CRISPR-associated endonuclease Cas1 n=1 Tax=Brumimicrobium aurantiacum TaxID=1737063 RepID=A0A3E1EYL4_9FLAO|nr:type V CRISPR-associated endonuclease Cas1 [Brumimicrobium aurantiacum]RFC54639.1 type V CRISPR-associated endonuclease Cas1 [Brumimicrobium aurantiacum]
MFTHKDIENRSIFVINGTKHQALRVSAGRLMLFDTKKEKAITKLPFPKILSLIIIGHTTLTSALIEKCNKNGIPLVIMKPNFKPVFYYGDMAEANFLLRKKQFEYPKGDLSIAIELIKNKTKNQRHLLKRTREKNDKVTQSIKMIDTLLPTMDNVSNYRELMGIEGKIAKHFFEAYFEFTDWKNRLPRVKQDTLNATMDIGYTFLFNYIESMLRLFGFDPYIGVYHQLWFRRKSLVCDLMEPFRCIIDHQIRKSLKYGTFKPTDFELHQNAYYLKSEKRKVYTKTFYEAIISRKSIIYKYTQQYYRCFMGRKSVTNYPIFDYE